MKTLEQKINKILHDCELKIARTGSKWEFREIEWWIWSGPEKEHAFGWGAWGTRKRKRIKYRLDQVIKKTIEQADISECLTSPSAFIRDYRKWYEANR